MTDAPFLGAGDAAEARTLLAEHGVDTVECGLADSTGALCGRRMTVERFLHVCEAGFATANAIFGWNVLGDIGRLEYTSFETGFPNVRTRPDLSTLRLAPWTERTALCLCDTYDWITAEPVPLDPRALVRRAERRLEAEGLGSRCAVELELYLRAADGTPLHDAHRSFGFEAAAACEPILGEIRRALELAGLPVESTQTEYGAGQVEINLGPSPAVAAADNAAILKYVAKVIARRHGACASFMAKPWESESASGQHVHVSLLDPEGDNTFSRDADGEWSATLRHFVGGVLGRQVECAALYLPTVNSYRRLRAESATPTAVTWGVENRSVLVRVLGDGASTRVETRTAGADASPHHVVAATLAAGAGGIAGATEPPERTTGSAYASETAVALPRDLATALDALEQSSFARELLGPELLDAVVTNGRAEVAWFSNLVTTEERARYFGAV